MTTTSILETESKSAIANLIFNFGWKDKITINEDLKLPQKIIDDCNEYFISKDKLLLAKIQKRRIIYKIDFSPLFTTIR